MNILKISTFCQTNWPETNFVDKILLQFEEILIEVTEVLPYTHKKLPLSRNNRQRQLAIYRRVSRYAEHFL